MKNKLAILGLALALIFSILLVPNPAQAAKKTVTIQLKADNEDINLADRILKFWKLSDQTDVEDKEALVIKLAKESNQALDQAYADYQLSEKSGADGLIKIDLEPGTYYVRELTTDPLAQVSPFVYVLTAEGGDLTILPKLVLQHPKKEVEIHKISAGKEPLAGAEFRLYRLEDGQEVPVPLTQGSYDPQGATDSLLVTKEDGRLTIKNLPDGSYLLRETKAPAGYEIAKADTYFTIKDGQGLKLEIVNYKKPGGGKTFKKVNPQSQPLAGARFIVHVKNGDLYEKYLVDGQELILESDDLGFFRVDNLPPGDYYLWEVQAPEGYEPLSGPVKFTVGQGSSQEVIHITNKQIGIQVDPPPQPPTDKNPPPIITDPPPGPNPPPTGTNPPPGRPIIPKTGDMTIFLIVGAALAFIVLGSRMLREETAA